MKRNERTGSSGRASAPQRCVLVVDDEVDILELIELTLLRMGLDVERAMSVRDAATQLPGSRHYDLCLTDMRLPDGTGLVYTSGLTADLEFWVLNLATTMTRRVAKLTLPDEIRTFDLAPDGKQIIFDRLRENADVVLIERRQVTP